MTSDVNYTCVRARVLLVILVEMDGHKVPIIISFIKSLLISDTQTVCAYLSDVTVSRMRTDGAPTYRAGRGGEPAIS